MATQRAVERLRALQRHILPTQHGEGYARPQQPIETDDCCGIVAYVGKEPAVNYLLEGLTILESRGYDSAGLTTISPGKELITTKFASHGTTHDAIEKLKRHAKTHDGHFIGIAHTRWATHGGKTDYNAHPHHDMNNRISLVHNGVIENSAELKEELLKEGIKFVSETDTEVIAQLIGYYIHKHGMNTLEAVKKAQSRLEGTWGLAILDREHPDQIIASRNGSPILIGIGKDRMFVASEPAAFGQHTKEYIALENGEIAVVKADGSTLDLSRVELAPSEAIQSSPHPWPHWTIKEIMEQPKALARALNYGGRLLDDARAKLGGLDDKRDVLLQIRHLVVAACGTSLFAGMLGAQYMRSLHSFETVQVVDAAELHRDDLPRHHGGLLVISQSGETKDVHRALMAAQEAGLPTISVVNAVGSLIARSAGCGVYLNAGREHAVASTKAFTASVTVLALVAVWFAQQHREEEQKRRMLVDALHRLPINVGVLLGNACRRQCKAVAERLKDAQHCFILGKGHAEPIAREGALKIKEITYLHAEGYAGGALKHGPFALIEQDTPIIVIILDDQHEALMRTTTEEVKARGAWIVAITNRAARLRSIVHEIVEIPSNGPLTALLAVVPLQLIAYELAVLKGNDPDKPRNLAKAVTVD